METLRDRTEKIKNSLLSRLMGVRVYALVGKSGTGKSFRARLLAEKYGIPYMIDDGLLINDKRIMAGKSAKKEKLYVSAIKTALFDDPQHRKEVKSAIKKENIKKILLIGTSEKMVNKVTRRLGLPPVSRVIKIEDIASREDIEKAIHARYKEGKHIIPVPSIEVKRDYAHIFSSHIRILFKSPMTLRKDKKKIFEKAVVTPEFANEQSKGHIVISESALGQMVIHCIDEYDCEIEVIKISVRKDRKGYRIKVIIGADYGRQLGGSLHDLQGYVLDKIERFTGILIEEVSIEIAKVSPRKKASSSKQRANRKF